MGSRAVDCAIAGVVGVVATAGTLGASRHGHPAHPLDALAFVLVAVAAGALLWRRAAPLTVLTVTGAAALVFVLRGYGLGPIFLPLVVAFLTAAPRYRRWPMYALPAVGYAVIVWGVPWATGEPVPSTATAVGIGAWLLTLIAVAEVVRQRREAIRARRARERDAARVAEEERLRRASDERLDIARELHDVLAHSLSLINVQSGVALELLDSRPEQAGIALASIKDASRDALVQVHTMLQSLRHGTEAAPLTPAPSITDLDRLVAHARNAGIGVTTTVSGDPRAIPTGTDLAAARIVQESLTNVVRHSGRTTARVTVRFLPEVLEVEVDDDGRITEPPRPGAGITGMTERCRALGGTLTAAPRPGGGFRVLARLPLLRNESGVS
ncbi:sensor histidine kinase [Rhodococcus sp. Q]|uniref:sensor histidine kinase n=1 Tax=Rhodococcus sp. Q TaxID=2502252 RepID=UPI0010F93369|nr:sensor histidine kinase [Rhodococcus sp. Q]